MAHWNDAALGHVLGRVLDQGGSAVDGAVVTLRQPGTGLTRSLITDANGWFGAVDLTAGEWMMRVQPGAGGILQTARLVAGQGRVDQPVWWPAPEDADGDGWDNESELVAGTDPGSADSRLRLRLEHPPAGNVALRVEPQVLGRRYRVERRLNLAIGAWEPLATWDDPRFIPVEDSAQEGAAFYRVRVELR